MDIAGFTQLSQTVSPLQLATTVNSLFSQFDRAVLGRDLFKIDTIGDAYIIVGTAVLLGLLGGIYHGRYARSARSL